MDTTILTSIAILFAGLVTFWALKTFAHKLPKDGGREFAFDGKVSAGRPRGAGLVFILTFVVFGAVATLPIAVENIIYILLVFGAMITGFLDDCAATPWGEYKKGILDLLLAVVTGWSYYNFNGSTIDIPFVAHAVTLNPVLFIILATVLVWVSINVTNCTDGVDGLSGSLAIVTLGGMYFLVKNTAPTFAPLVLVMIAVILAYLWYNATPNIMMMGDGGSRAIGIFIAIVALKTGSPFLYIPLALLFIIDGGLGLLKVSLLRFLKIKILANTRTPIHDHMRKNKDWSNTQVVFRFVILQVAITYLTLSFIA